MSASNAEFRGVQYVEFVFELLRWGALCNQSCCCGVMHGALASRVTVTTIGARLFFCAGTAIGLDGAGLCVLRRWMGVGWSRGTVRFTKNGDGLGIQLRRARVAEVVPCGCLSWLSAMSVLTTS